MTGAVTGRGTNGPTQSPLGRHAWNAEGGEGGDLEHHEPVRPTSQAVPRVLVFPQLSVLCHCEIEMTASCHREEDAKTGSTTGKQKTHSVEDDGRACRARAHGSWTLHGGSCSDGSAFLGIFGLTEKGEDWGTGGGSGEGHWE